MKNILILSNQNVSYLLDILDAFNQPVQIKISFEKKITQSLSRLFIDNSCCMRINKHVLNETSLSKQHETGEAK